MKFFNLFRIAYRSHNRNKLRSFLTMLGIIIGVASVIAMLAIGEGSNQNIKKSISSLGTNSIFIYPGTNTNGGVRGGAGSNQTLKLEDADAIAAHCDLVKYVTPGQTHLNYLLDAKMRYETVYMLKQYERRYIIL